MIELIWSWVVTWGSTIGLLIGIVVSIYFSKYGRTCTLYMFKHYYSFRTYINIICYPQVLIHIWTVKHHNEHKTANWTLFQLCNYLCVFMFFTSIYQVSVKCRCLYMSQGKEFYFIFLHKLLSHSFNYTL